MKDKIVLLVGGSGVGKTTIAKELESMDYNIIHSFTTREPREPDEWGHTFIENARYEGDSSIVGDIPNEKQVMFLPTQMIAVKQLYGNFYFATRTQYKNKGTSIYVIDPDGAEQVRENIKDAEIVTIFLMADDVSRGNRMWKQGRNSEDINSRISKDQKIFSKFKTDYVVDGNRGLPEVLADIKEIIGGM